MKPNWFVAVPVPAPWLSNLLRSAPEQCRGFRPEDVHMTIAFLGAMDPALQSVLVPILERVRVQPFGIKLGKLLALPSPKKVSALSLEVCDGRDTACELISQLRDPLIKAAGARADNRPPLPHITVARPIRKFKNEGQKAALAWVARQAALEETVRLDRIAIYTWSEDRSVRQFRVVYERMFQDCSAQ